LKGLEFVAYRQNVINLVKERWSNAISRPGLVAKVRFNIAPNGAVSGVKLEQSSGNVVYDQTAVAAVERVGQLPPPPSAYLEDFREFHMTFFGEEMGGMS
jgi:TolA protein